MYKRYEQTTYIKFHIDRISPHCRVGGTNKKSISQQVSEGSKFGQKQYKARRDILQNIHWEIMAL